MLMGIGDRIRRSREQIGLSQSELARRLGIRPQSVQQWEDGKTEPRPKKYQDIASALEVDKSWLQTGMTGISEEVSPYYSAPGIGGRVPLVSWVQAGSMAEVEDPHAPGVAEDWITTTVQVRDHTFALRVRGDSMEPEFPNNIIIIVEPDMQYENGDYVVVRNSHDEATFKQLVQDGGDWYLKPVNPRYPIKPLGDAVVVGVVREAVKKYR